MKQRWQEQVGETEHLYNKYGLSIRQLAEMLDISAGKVCTDLKLARALRAYHDMEKIVNYTDAMKFMKKKRFRKGMR